MRRVEPVAASLLCLIIAASALVASQNHSYASSQDESSDNPKLLGRTRGVPDSGFWNNSRGLGLLPSAAPATGLARASLLQAPPNSFSWNGYFGGSEYMTAVRDQEGCGSCWAFATIGVTEAQYQIGTSNPSTGIDLSEQNVLSCSGGSCSGWYIDSALNFLRDYGTPDEACNPYTATDRPCGSGRCSDYLTRTWHINGWTRIATDAANIKNYLYAHGPVVVAMAVFSDFPWWNAYFWQYYFYAHQYVPGELFGGHAVIIVGWDDQGPGIADDYWILRNSWGAGGGDVNSGYGGYFYVTQDPAQGLFGIYNEAYLVTSVAPPNAPPTVSSLMPEKSPPQVVGTAITWTCSASDPEGDALVYRFFVQPAGGSWSVVRDWSGSSTWSWIPSRAGSYNIACHVRDGGHAGSTGWDDHKEYNGYGILSAPPNNPPSISILTSDVASPQVVGTTITWTCAATDVEGDSLLYRFWIRPSGGYWSVTRDWSSFNMWAWTPTVAKTYDIACHVRDGRHSGQTGWDDHKEAYSYAITSGPPNSLPVISGLTSDRASPQVVGTAITWTCSASDTEGDSILYRFFVRSSGGSWSMVRDWSGTNSWSWTPTVAGNYNIACHVRDGKHADGNGWDDHREFYGYSILSAPPNSLPVISSLSPDKASPQAVGSTVVWTCSATDAESDLILHRFFVQPSGGSWGIVRDWSTVNTWAWTPTAAGTFNVACHVRDGKHAGVNGWDDHREFFGYNVLSAPPNNPPVISNLTPDKASGSQVVGAAILWTCLATDAENDPILYRFFVRASARSWSVVQDWSASNSWSWTPTSAGSYDIACHVRDGKHQGPSGWDDHEETYGYSVLSPPPNNAPVISSLSPDKASPQLVGTTITWTCSASDTEGDSISYRFWTRLNGGAWTVARDWSTSNTWAWTPMTAGTWDIACHVRDGKHAGVNGWDDHKEAYSYIITSGILTASLSLGPGIVLGEQMVELVIAGLLVQYRFSFCGG